MKTIPFDIALREQIQSEENHYHGRYKVQTRRGNNVRILCLDKKDPTFPIVALVMNYPTVEATLSFRKDGKYYPGGKKSGNDLYLVDTWELELKESEDERIRKELWEYFHELELGSDRDFSPSLTIDDILAWLEKQKETSKAIEAVEKIDKYIDEHLANAHDMKDSNPDKKYYCGWDDALGKIAGILEDVYSEEKKKESLRDFIDDFPYSAEKYEKDYHKVYEDIAKSDQSKKASVGKSLGEEFEQKEQKPAEWSEEDLQHKSWILECLADGERKMPEYAEDFRAAYKWLKSLRPSWKPSEEQMEELNKVRTLNPGLDALYQQLKNM